MEDKKIVIIDSNILDGKKINTKISNKKIAMLVLSAEMHTLLKQELKIAKNTVGFQNIMSQIKLHGLEYANNILSKTVILKENVNNIKEKLVDKSKLAKERINLKVAHAKNILIRKPAMEIALIKESIKNKLLNIKNSVSTKISSTKENVKDTAMYASTLVGVTALDIKEKLIDKSTLAKERINLKVAHAKNILIRKPAMEIALIKESIKNKLLNIKNSVSTKISSTKENVKDTAMYASTLVGVTALDIKEKLIDKSTLAKEHINLKVAHAKNVLIRKPAMEIALIKQSIREKAKLLASNTSAKIIENLRSREKVLEEKNANLAERKARIDALKKERETLLGQLTNDSNSYARSM